MLFRLFEKIRKKPKAVRDQYAFFSAACVTSIIAVVWLVSLSVTSDSVSSPSTEVDKRAGGAFSQFMSDAKVNFGGIISAVQQLKGGTEEESESEEVFDIVRDEETVSSTSVKNERTFTFSTSTNPTVEEKQERSVLIEILSGQRSASSTEANQ